MTEMASSRPFSRPALPLAVGDVAVLVVVVVIGELTHDVNPITQPLQVAATLAPFLVGWVLLAAILGLYGDAPADLLTSVRLTIGTWFGAANVGLILRDSPYLHGDVTWPFPLVITGFVFLGLVAWRVVAGLAMSRGTSGSTRSD